MKVKFSFLDPESSEWIHGTDLQGKEHRSEGEKKCNKSSREKYQNYSSLGLENTAAYLSGKCDILENTALKSSQFGLQFQFSSKLAIVT